MIVQFKHKTRLPNNMQVKNSLMEDTPICYIHKTSMLSREDYTENEIVLYCKECFKEEV